MDILKDIPYSPLYVATLLLYIVMVFTVLFIKNPGIIFAVFCGCIALTVTYAILRYKLVEGEKEIKLDENERALIEYLKKNKEILQEDIKDVFNWSKAKVSMVVKKLEEKGIIVRERVGRTYRIRLKE